jgi:hypothetical protein
MDVDVGPGPEYHKLAPSAADFLATALAGLRLKRVGLHASSGCRSLYIPYFDVPEMHRTFYIGKERIWYFLFFENPYLARLEDQIDDASRRNVTKLTLHVERISACPTLSGFSVLRELVIGDSWRDFGNADPAGFVIKGLEVVAGTLRHLTVSSSREDTCVEVPPGLRLRSFVCVCSGTLLLCCDARVLSQSLGGVLLGYTSIAGSGARLVRDFGPRLGAAVVEVHGLRKLSQSLLFTRASLVGEWWYGVLQPSKQAESAGCFCCRVRIWAQGRMCPPYLTFLRYGILSAHDDREILWGFMDEPLEESSMSVFPAWQGS